MEKGLKARNASRKKSERRSRKDFGKAIATSTCCATCWTSIGSIRAAYFGTTAGQVYASADADGSNGSRSRLWKVAVQRLANQLGLAITVCHFPPGTSKWNKIEHRLFSQIAVNWRGRPLTSHQVIVQLIATT